MARAMRPLLERYATRRMCLVALAGVVAGVAELVWRQVRLAASTFDSRGWYTPESAAALFDALDRLDANARLVYATTGLAIDMAFPWSSPCSRFERVQHVHVQSRYVRHVACHEGQSIDLGRRGQERIDNRYWTDRIHLAPLLGNSRIDG